MFRTPLHLGLFCLFIATLTLSSVFAIAGFFLGVLVTAIVSITWGIFMWRNWIFGNILCMLIFVLGISLAVFSEGSRIVLLISLLATLTTWDLATFNAQLSSSKHVADQDLLIHTHLLRLAYVLIISLTLPLVTFTFQFALKFWQVFLLGLMLLAGLSQVFSQLKRDS